VAFSFSHGLLERETELRRLGSVLDEARERRGGLALLCGPAGIGKTRLLYATCAEAGRRSMRVLSAHGSDLEQQFAYGVVRQLFEGSWMEAGGGGKPARVRGPAAYAAPVFAPTDLDRGSSAPMDRSAAVLHGLYWLTCELAGSRPLLLAVDDAHWADLPSLLCLDYLIRRLDALPVAIVLSFRGGGSGPEAELLRRAAADPQARVLELPRLSAEGSAELVRSLLGPGTDAEVCRGCHAATGGNPFLLHELATALAAEEALGSKGSVRVVERLVPDAVARHVLVRLARLGPSSIRVAHSLAVLGPGAELRHVAELAALDLPEAADCVDALVSADIVSPGSPLDFLHPLLREGVYLDLGPGERMLAHGRAARILADSGSPPERVALQLLAAEPSPTEWAAQTLRQAATEALARGAPALAVRYLEGALAGGADVADKDRLLFELGVAESRAGLMSAADHLSAALQLASDSPTRAAIAQELAALDNLLGRFAEAAGVLEQTIDCLGDSEPELSFSLQAEAAVLGVTVLEGRRKLALRMAQFRARAPALAVTPHAAPLLAVIAEELTEAEGTMEEVALYAERAFTDASLLSREGPVLVIGASALIIADKPARAEAILDLAIASADARGSLHAHGLALAFRAFARNRRGLFAGAEADARRSLELSAEQPSDPVSPFKAAQLAEALVEQGELAAAEKLLAEAELAAWDRDSKLFQPLANLQARFRLLRGQARDALVLLRPQLEWMEAWGCRLGGWTSARSLAALAHGALGETSEARTLAAEELEAAQSFGAPQTLGIALRTLALVEEHDRIGRLRESTAVLQKSESRLELARTLVELGSALRRAGRRREAREPLRRGLELASDCGGTLVAERGRAELLSTGARPRRPRVTGADSLTASERRVAALAKEGRSNREIAAELFLSPKTVEMHLSHAYRKLEIRSRSQLAQALQRDESTGG
jgi:DNA-binding CsgD family transcriptional regulator